MDTLIIVHVFRRSQKIDHEHQQCPQTTILGETVNRQINDENQGHSPTFLILAARAKNSVAHTPKTAEPSCCSPVKQVERAHVHLGN